MKIINWLKNLFKKKEPPKTEAPVFGGFMKTLLLASCLLMASCASKVMVNMERCKKAYDKFYVCEEVE